jgi:hypothetical protein
MAEIIEKFTYLEKVRWFWRPELQGEIISSSVSGFALLLPGPQMSEGKYTVNSPRTNETHKTEIQSVSFDPIKLLELKHSVNQNLRLNPDQQKAYIVHLQCVT